VKKWFTAVGWKEEQPAFSVPGMQYDLLKERTPIEIEIGHERLPQAENSTTTAACIRRSPRLSRIG